MSTISSYLTSDHRHCDEAFVATERLVVDGRWESAGSHLAEFVDGVARHLACEEDLLFPAFEAATGSGAGPTTVMRMEHQQIRRLLDALRDALARRDREDYLGISETLLLLMQQHNAKEENILYPLADRVLHAESAGLVGRMQAR